jgi:hypothetical protein
MSKQKLAAQALHPGLEDPVPRQEENSCHGHRELQQAAENCVLSQRKDPKLQRKALLTLMCFAEWTAFHDRGQILRGD